MSAPDTALVRALPGVLLIDLAAGHGGAEKRVLQLGAQLPSHGVTCAVVALGDRPLQRQARELGITVHTLRKSKWDPRNVLALRQLLRAHPGWVLDAHNSQSQLTALLASPLRARRSPVVATVHSDYAVSEADDGRLRTAMLRLASRAGWRLVPISNTVRDYLSRVGLPSGAVVWGAADPVAPATEEQRAQTRAELGAEPSTRLLVAAGRLVPAKNYPLLLRAFALLRQRRPEVRLAIAGDGPERERLRELCEELSISGRNDGLEFLGHRADVPNLFRAADVCVLTSVTEGLPYTLLEAAMVATPIVSTSVGSIPAIFAEGAAELLPAFTADDHTAPTVLADRLEGLLDDRARLESLGLAAQTRVASTLTMDNMINATVAQYRFAPEFVARRRTQ